jgi:hypothetical protein
LQLVANGFGPVIEDANDRRLVVNPEREIEVREPVAAAKRQRPDDRAPDDTAVVFGELQHAFLKRVSLSDREHDGRF